MCGTLNVRGRQHTAPRCFGSQCHDRQRGGIIRRAENWHSPVRLTIIRLIERTYDRRRRQRRLGKLSPVEFETIMEGAVTLAAQGT
jgi:hypothetical protein